MNGDPLKYFMSYEDLKVHHLMLSDRCRTETYKKAIFSLEDYIKDKVVMDVGAGTGILSVFCAQAGAKKVYAVEASNIAKLTERVVKDNKFSDIIQVLHSRVEDVELPDEEKVDAIVSEWMGFYLLHEGMLDSVLAARDKHLKPGGKLLPEVASLYACPCSLPAQFDFWTDVYGVNMSAIGQEARKVKSNHPEIIEVSSQHMLSKPILVCQLNLATITTVELDALSSKHVATVSRNGTYHGLCLWFSCSFPSPDPESEPVVLSTSPAEPPTHWKQTVIVLPDELPVKEGEPIAWELILKRHGDSPRMYNLEFTMLDPMEEEHPVPCYCHMTKCIVIRTFMECEKEPIDENSEGDVMELC